MGLPFWPNALLMAETTQKTSCPNCKTIYDTTREQLRTSQGWMRCGFCQRVFDAREALITPELSKHEQNPLIPPANPSMSRFSAEEGEAARQKNVPDGYLNPTQSVTAVPQVAVTTNPRVEESRPDQGWPWVAGCVLCLLILTFQLLAYFRIDWAAQYPTFRPVVIRLSHLFGLPVPLPRKINQLTIDYSDLTTSDDDQITLVSHIRNTAPYAQQYPQLELTLTDQASRPLTRRVIQPDEYLPPAQSILNGFQANGELEIQLSISTNVNASGYRIFIFYQ